MAAPLQLLKAMDPRSTGGRTLNGWKEIAAYLGKSVRSAQRWELTLGLPVRRINTPDGHIVFAEPDEIDEWRRTHEVLRGPELEGAGQNASDVLESPIIDPPVSPGRSSPPTAWRRRWLMAGAGVLLFMSGAVSAWWVMRTPVMAVEIRYVGRTIEAIGRDGELAWTYQFDSDISTPSRVPSFVDLDGDGESEVLVPVRRSSRGGRPAVSDAVFCFTRTGELLWSVSPDRVLSFGGRSFAAPWDFRDLAVAQTPPPRLVWLAFAHHTWFPGFVLEIDPQGNQLLKYVQAGSIYSIAHWQSAAGGYLAVGGGSNEYNQATVALLPDKGPRASFPRGENAKFACDDCAPGTPARIFFFAPTELALANHEMVPYVQAVRVVGASLKATIADGPGRSVAMVNPDFSIDAIQFGQRYWAAHRDLENQGRLHHPWDDCPTRITPREVREWTPDRLWRSWSVMPAPDDH
jgi:hypothetical protein